MSTTEHQTFCRVCNAMCGLVVTTEGPSVIRVRGDVEHPLSRGYSCPKGRAIGELHHDPARIDQPLMGRADARRVVGWDELLDDLAVSVDDVRSSIGPDGVAMYLASGSAFDTAGRRAAERLLHRLGSRQKYTATTIDTPCKPLVAESVGGWSGLTPVWDADEATLLILFGSNPVVSHGHSNAMPDPVRRLRALRERGGELIVVDPRRTETAAMADVHLQPRPGSDWILLAWLVRELFDDHDVVGRADGADLLRAALQPLSLDVVANLTDLGADAITDLVAAVRRHARVNALTGTGCSMSEHASITEYLLWALHIVTDSYDTPGGMWFNPGLLLQLDQRELPTGDGSPGEGPPSRPEFPRRFDEWPCAALISEIEHGNVRALFVIGGNPALAFPDTERTRRALSTLDVLAVVDVLPTATTDLATHVLPAVDQLERADLTWLLDGYQLAVAGQFTPRVVEPAAERRPVWWSLGRLGVRLGLDVVGPDPDSVDEVDLLLPVMARSRVGADALRSSATALVHSGPVHGWVRERVLPDGRWRLAPPDLLAALERAIARPILPGERNLVLVPHRRLRLMNSQFERLAETTDEQISVRVHPDVAAEFGGDGTIVEVETANGSVTGPLRSDARLRPDTVTIGHGSEACDVSRLTSADDGIDPLTGMVLQSGLACRLRHCSPA